MRICLVHRDMHAVTRGGICTLYHALAPRLRDRGHDVILVTQATPHPVEVSGIDVVNLPRTDDMTMHRRAVNTAVTQLGPDVVECSSWEAELLDYVRRPANYRAPVVVRGDLSAATMQATALVDAEHELVSQADAITAVSDFASADLASAYGIAAPVVIPNGVDRTRFRPASVVPPTSGYQITLDATGAVASRTSLRDLYERGVLRRPWASEDDLPNLVWVGKITPMKGWDHLEALLPYLRGRAHLSIVLGHSPAFCPVSVTGGRDGVILQDLADADMVGLYSSADYLLSTSRWEGFGLAIAEALACGTPVLLPAQLGTARELLADGGGHRYRSTAHLLDLLSATARPTGSLPLRFDWDHNAAATIRTYQGLIERRGSRTGHPCASS